MNTISYTEAQRNNLPGFVTVTLEQPLEGLWWIAEAYEPQEVDILTTLRDVGGAQGITGIKPGNNPGGDPNV